jgi:hypothetical protein
MPPTCTDEIFGIRNVPYAQDHRLWDAGLAGHSVASYGVIDSAGFLHEQTKTPAACG